MTTITLQEVQQKLPTLLKQLAPGEELLITDDGVPLAQVRKVEQASRTCQAGTAKDKILWIAPDFDAPLEDFREYME